MSIIESDYREIIRQHYQDRSQRNPAYSLRAYARDLGIAFSRLHDAVTKKKGISLASARKIAAKLHLSENETSIFLAKIEAQHARSPERRRLAAERLERLTTLYGNRTLADDVFRLIQDWHHFALVELTQVEGFDPSPAWIGKRLGIHEAVAEQALERLLKLGLLRWEEGRLLPSDDFSLAESAVPSAAIRNNHEQVLRKAQQALHFQDVDARDFNALTVSFRKSDLPEAKKFIKSFLVEFDRRFGKAPERDSIYGFSTQLVRLDQEEK